MSAIREHGKQSHLIVLFVRDNGIDIKEKYYDSICRIFKWLHGREAFGMELARD